MSLHSHGTGTPMACRDSGPRGVGTGEQSLGGAQQQDSIPKSMGTSLHPSEHGDKLVSSWLCLGTLSPMAW